MTKNDGKQIAPLGIALGACALGCYGLAKLAPILQRTQRQATKSFAGQTVLITGGSRGLGLQLAETFLSEGCHVALCARSLEELERAQQELQQLPARKGDVAVFAFDITEEAAAPALIAAVTARFGKVDILVNDAGLIEVVNADAMRIEDFEKALDLMLYGHLRTILAVLPQMRERQSGHIVNISSIGGTVSVPRLLPYCTAKHAFTGLSKGLSVELNREGIHVLTVIPGLLRTGSFFKAKFKGDSLKEYSWFALGAALPFISQSAPSAAKTIVDALRQGKDQCITSFPAQALALADAIAPEFTRNSMRVTDQVLLPVPTTSQREIEGHTADRSMGSLFRAVTKLGRTAASALNEQTVKP